MRLRYNSPVILSFTFLAIAVLALNQTIAPWLIPMFFSSPANFSILSPFSPLFYFRLISYVLGHAGWAHLAGNFLIILIVGPLIEEKYGSRMLLAIMIITAFATGILNTFLFGVSLVGASGIVFMLIVLSSFTDFSKREIPITFILITILFIAPEFASSFEKDNVSQFGHILGGIGGGIFGFLSKRKQV